MFNMFPIIGALDVIQRSVEACLVPSAEVSNDVVGLTLQVPHAPGTVVIEEGRRYGR